MQWLILVLILVATYNATMATMGYNMRGSMIVYWWLVGMYWMLKAAEA